MLFYWGLISMADGTVPIPNLPFLPRLSSFGKTASGSQKVDTHPAEASKLGGRQAGLVHF